MKARTARLASLVLLAVLAFGTGCRATQHVVKLARPHPVRVAHELQRLHSAVETTNGLLLVVAEGRLAGATSPARVLMVLPPRTTTQPAERIVVRADSTRPESAGGNATLAGVRPVPVGPPLKFTGAETYFWDWLRPTEGREREVRLVQRPGMLNRWEVLDMRNSPDGVCRHTVYEVELATLTIKHPAAFALVPLAFASDVVAVGTMASGPVAFVGAIGAAGVLLPPIGVYAWAGLAGLGYVNELEPVKELTGKGTGSAVQQRE